MARRTIAEGSKIIIGNMTFTIGTYDPIFNRYNTPYGYFYADYLQRMLDSGEAKLEENRDGL